jgi:uncharacterized protein (DUF1800 family)
MRSQRTVTIRAACTAIVGLSLQTATGYAQAPQQMEQQAKTTSQKVAQPKFNLKPLSEEQKIVHVLNRLGFGPRPGDVQRVTSMGLKAYIEQQLNPSSISDTDLDQKLSEYTTLKMSGTDIAEMERSVQMSNANLLRIQNQMAQRGAEAGSQAIQGAISNAQAGTAATPQQNARRALDVYQNATPEERKILDEGRMARQKQVEAGSQLVMNKIIRAAESNRQLNEVLVDFWANHFNIDASKVRASIIVDEENVIRPHVLGKFKELLQASANSAAMMLYLDNAQSVSPPPARPQRPVTFDQLQRLAARGLPQPVQLMKRINERAAAENITPEEAFAKIQAMPAPLARPGQKLGLNENYARELMELHTLGVDGGYTQKDVTEVARCLTGWGVKGGRYTGEFEFHPNLHDRGAKTVLGVTIPAGGGMEDGQKVLELLANHPSTMKFISTKLCKRFVADNPPASLIDRCVATWKRTDGDIKEIMATIINSKEFMSHGAFQSKIKSPFEYVVSAVRASGASILTRPPAPLRPALAAFQPAAFNINVFAQNGTGQANPRLLAGQIGLLGQPLFNYGFPTGYPEDSAKWVSTGALIGRINFALSLTGGKLNDVDMSASILKTTDISQMTTEKQVDVIARDLLGEPLSAKTRDTIVRELGQSAVPDPRKIASLILGSPEFQRR